MISISLRKLCGESSRPEPSITLSVWSLGRRLQKEGEVNNRHGQCGYPPLKCARVFIFSSHEHSSLGDWGDCHGTWHVVLRLTLLTLKAEYDGQRIGDEERSDIQAFH